MPTPKYLVDCRTAERATVAPMRRSGKTGARKLTRARMRRQAADGLRADALAAA